MSEPDDAEVPIFELGLAIVPGERVSLHIFERRYRLMIGHCLEEDLPFGIVFRDEDGARATGCTAEVTEVRERYEDGRMDIVVTGADPFGVLDRFEAADWPAGRVAWIDHAPAGPELAEELGASRAAFAELLEAVGANRERAEAAPGAFAIAAQIEMPAAEKQALLEAADERERLVLLESSLRRLLGGLKRSRELGERAKTNGHAPGRIGPIQRPEPPEPDA